MLKCFSLTANRDRMYRHWFANSGLRSVTTELGEGTIMHCWIPKVHRASRPSLILVHGFGANAMWQFADHVRHFTPHFNVYVPDLIFFGRSKTARSERTEAFQARCLMRLMEVHGLSTASIVGVSYGGFVAYSLADQFPDSVERLVLCCTGVCLVEKDLEEGLFAVSNLEDAISILLPQSPKKLKQLLKLSFVKPARGVPPCFLSDFIRVMYSDHVQEKKELITSLLKERKDPNLPRINHPTLVLWGEQDKIFPLELGHRLKGHIGENAQMVTVKNAGHAVNLEKPKETTLFREDAGWSFSRFLSSGGLGSEQLEDAPDAEERDDLRSRVFRLRLPKRSVTNVLEKWAAEGNRIPASELRQISKELSRHQRFKHALEVSEWMVTHKEYDLLENDYILRIELMAKVFGVDASERYFESLPTTEKTSETYTSLLHCYAGAKLIDRAENLFERMMDSGLSFGALAYNEMMTMYMSVGLVEKVPLVVGELKRQSVVPDIFTYNLWISSCAATLNMDEVRRILDEMGHDSSSKEEWERYRSLANVYITSGQLLTSEHGGLVEVDKRVTQREWITYDFLIILYASMGNKEKIDRIWRSLKMTKEKMTSRNYVCILSSFLILGHLKEVGDILSQWKQSTAPSFDLSACNRLMDSFKEIGLVERANQLQILMFESNCYPSVESK
ncbi:hypothetical protein SAY86_022129 [Trapa natans]|uniref:AB hydrolase-1 domain-containing protein n=1 Tax=Trapa natans TaxID=22666 RepID=A0AAN7MB30_TRANT|nr:hypothetical protein SAY86_022129 [Trapa natans]